jgi:hypothetical protein
LLYGVVGPSETSEEVLTYFIIEEAMSRVFVDSQEVQTTFPGAVSLDQVVQHLEENVLAPDTVIRQIHIGGVPVISQDAERTSEILRSSIVGRGDIEVSTGSVKELATDSITEALAYLDRIDTLTPRLAASFQVTPGPEAFESLRQLYEGFYWVNLLIDRLDTTFQIGFETMLVDGENAGARHRKFLDILRQMVDAQERQDFLLISDLLQYEVLAMVPVWRSMFAELERRIGIPS